MAPTANNPPPAPPPAPPPPPGPASTATALRFDTIPADPVAGADLSLVVAVVDSAGTVVVRDTAQVTLALDSAAQAGLSGPLTVQAAGGRARFTVAIHKAADGYRFTARSSGLASATSTPLSVRAGPAAKLAFRTQPGEGVASEPLFPFVDVEIRDRFDNLAARASDTVRLAIAANPGNATLAGTASVAANAGVASFTDLQLNQTGAGYSMTASATGLTGSVSDTFSIVPVVVVNSPPQMAAGTNASCAIATDHTTQCWGLNHDGQLGTGRPLSRDTATRVIGGLAFTTISAGSDFTCGLTASGEAWCWGANYYGTLGDGTPTIRDCLWNGGCHDSAAPRRVAGGHTFVSLSASWDQACGIGADGIAWCWGMQHSGESDESDLGQRTPYRANPRTDFAQVSAGRVHGCGLTSAGAGYCWGVNSDWTGAHYSGMLGNGDTSSPDRAVVSGGHTFVQITAGPRHSCGLTAAGEAWCWGPDAGPVGAGDTSGTSIPEPVAGGHTFTRLATGTGYTCGLERAGTAWCWGVNDAGQLGDGTTTMRRTPVAVAGGLSFASIFAGFDRTCGLTSVGQAWCWGSNLEFARTSIVPFSTTTSPVPVMSNLTFTALAIGSSTMCGLTNAGDAWCRGLNDLGSLGDGGAVESATPLPVAGSHDFSTIVTTFDRSCGLTSATGEVWCWGNVDSHHSGAPRSATPLHEAAGMTFRMIGVGEQSSCGLTMSGEAWCWGDNTAGQLGDGSFTSSVTPVQVRGGLHFIDLRMGGATACGLTATGAAWCWGLGIAGALGNGGTTSSAVPVMVSAAPRFAAISVGGSHVCALTPGGSAWCWGLNLYGQLGNGGRQATVGTPVRVSTQLRFTSLSAGMSGTCAVDVSGASWCWGSYVGYGAVPVAIAGGFRFTSLSAADAHVCGVSSDGTLRCWGANPFGELGDGTTTNSSVPVRVQTSHTFMASTRMQR